MVKVQEEEFQTKGLNMLPFHTDNLIVIKEHWDGWVLCTNIVTISKNKVWFETRQPQNEVNTNEEVR